MFTRSHTFYRNIIHSKFQNYNSKFKNFSNCFGILWVVVSKMNEFFSKKRTLVLSVIIILSVFALNLTAQRSINEAMAALRHIPISRVLTDKNAVALTFNLTADDNADLILSRLGSRKATFFISREYLYLHPEKVKEIADKGHGIGLLESQLKNTERAVIFDTLSERTEETAAVTGVNCNLIRIEQNKYDGDGISTIYSLGLYPVQWSADGYSEHFNKGDIILIENIAKFESLLESIEKSGYAAVPAEALLIKGSYSVDIDGTMLPE